MSEYEIPKQEFFRGRPALEFNPKGVRLWEGMKPVDLTDCDRMIVIADGNAIEFQCGRQIYLYCLKGNPPISISSPYAPPFEDKPLNSPISSLYRIL